MIHLLHQWTQRSSRTPSMGTDMYVSFGPADRDNRDTNAVQNAMSPHGTKPFPYGSHWVSRHGCDSGCLMLDADLRRRLVYVYMYVGKMVRPEEARIRYPTGVCIYGIIVPREISHILERRFYRAQENLLMFVTKCQHGPQPDGSLSTSTHLYPILPHVTQECIPHTASLEVPRQERPLTLSS